MPERFNGVMTKDLPEVVQDKIKTLSHVLEITEGAVIHAIITDWVAREAAEIFLFAKRTSSNVYPLRFDDFANVVLGEKLFCLLKAEHLKELAAGGESAEIHEMNLQKIRREIQPSKEEVENKIERILQWTHENKGLSRTPENDKTLAFMIVLYGRAGFSEDQIKELIAGETEYLRQTNP